MIARWNVRRLLGSQSIKDSKQFPLFMQSDTKVVRTQREVPVGSAKRLANMGSLGASIVGSTIKEAVKQSLGLSRPVDKNYRGIKRYAITQETADRLADSLCQLRGAALKIGQVISTFEDEIVPPLIKSALERARAQADFLPNDQLLQCLEEAYGNDWRSLFSSFNLTPMAAASIGQVHEAVLKENKTRVAIKIQYPGIACSVDQDLDNFLRISHVTHLFPRRLFLDEIVEQIRIEFKEECDYFKEADKLRKYKEMLRDREEFLVPTVYEKYSTNKCLCMDYMEGTPIDQLTSDDTPQETRNYIGTLMLDLCLRELFLLNFMQTDPNPANFFYDQNSKKLILIDLGAGKFFEKGFVNNYMGIVQGAAENNHAQIINYSKRMALLSGEENRKMINAHLKTVLAIGEGFTQKGDPFYDFSTQEATKKVFELIPVMIENRLCPPPESIIPLHRKLSGAFLQCVRFRARVPSRKIFTQIFEQWKRDTGLSL